MKTCAECSQSIGFGEMYYSIGDNFLQFNYFEREDGSDNIFCSQQCLMDSLSVEQDEVEE
ncbi:MAG: hypothetical protein LKE77_08365 [Companilactobacillus sp.]|jgi:hypothetical protein|uniref:hypothetical protein n=1 Tax=Companilactobacillus sp. TaxID=2767905 RepID=UPI0025C37459|nr:hypothetical protein [Companilactobacillus sp.]MCH4010356.1 hypothetical protein [Companilactobacillus sp.]MCH4051968.1 hypothetical protein [Companilactobacillus sp.]MCH4075796.1 hypothetical protein [Companilactobacillus sp.]MCH4126874.1 hypothetical protein [Companilactobacillus sp.]